MTFDTQCIKTGAILFLADPHIFVKGDAFILPGVDWHTSSIGRPTGTAPAPYPAPQRTLDYYDRCTDTQGRDWLLLRVCAARSGDVPLTSSLHLRAASPTTWFDHSHSIMLLAPGQWHWYGADGRLVQDALSHISK